MAATSAAPAGTPRNRKPIERSGAALQVVLMDAAQAREYPKLAVTPDIATFLRPMTPEQFLAPEGPFRQRRALAVKCHASLRSERVALIKQLLFNFSKSKMLENSNSAETGISVWMAVPDVEAASQPDLGQESSPGPQRIQALKLEPQQAGVCYDAGHSLYFRANEALESQFVPGYAEGIGCRGFTKWFRDGQRRGEVETFATAVGHTTGWHWDFQENFTIQLRGRKKWYLYRGDTVDTPHRAMASHYTLDDGNKRLLHYQTMLHRLDNPAFSGWVPSAADAEAESIVLQPGDVLYHPPGLWHKTETLEAASGGPDEMNCNSLSINVSLFPITVADVLQSGIQQLLVSRKIFRQRLQVSSSSEAIATLASALTSLADDVRRLEPSDFLTPSQLQHCADRDVRQTLLPPITSVVATVDPHGRIISCLPSHLRDTILLGSDAAERQQEVNGAKKEASTGKKRGRQVADKGGSEPPTGSTTTTTCLWIRVNPLAQIGRFDFPGAVPGIPTVEPSATTASDDDSVASADSDSTTTDSSDASPAVGHRVPSGFRRYDCRINFASEEDQSIAQPSDLYLLVAEQAAAAGGVDAFLNHLEGIVKPVRGRTQRSSQTNDNGYVRVDTSAFGPAVTRPLLNVLRYVGYLQLRDGA